jgi:polyisoprenoid-binding protein YceI
VLKKGRENRDLFWRCSNVNFRRLSRKALALILAAGLWPSILLCQSRTIDAEHSGLKVRVYKTGFFSAFAHNHEIDAPVTQGAVDTSEQASVKLSVDARKLRVVDPEVSEKDRGDIQKTMLGPEVLDSEHFPEIVFKSTAVEPNGADRWTVRGELTLHGQTRPVAVDVSYRAGHYTGQATLKQTEFGIKPVSIAGGTVKVKDAVRVEFDIQLAP